MTQLGLTVNEAETSLKNALQERFDFLGYPSRRFAAMSTTTATRGEPACAGRPARSKWCKSTAMKE
jgi:hypothetical protein